MQATDAINVANHATVLRCYVLLGDRQVLKSKGLEPISLGAKEGLALINGTQMMTAIGAEALHRAQNVALCADITAALSVEVLKGYAPLVTPVDPASRIAVTLMTSLSRMRP